MGPHHVGGPMLLAALWVLPGTSPGGRASCGRARRWRGRGTRRCGSSAAMAGLTPDAVESIRRGVAITGDRAGPGRDGLHDLRASRAPTRPRRRPQRVVLPGVPHPRRVATRARAAVRLPAASRPARHAAGHGPPASGSPLHFPSPNGAASMNTTTRALLAVAASTAHHDRDPDDGVRSRRTRDPPDTPHRGLPEAMASRPPPAHARTGGAHPAARCARRRWSGPA